MQSPRASSVRGCGARWPRAVERGAGIATRSPRSARRNGGTSRLEPRSCALMPLRGDRSSAETSAAVEIGARRSREFVDRSGPSAR